VFIEVKDEDDGIRVLTLTRPPANALTLEVIEELKRAMIDIGADAKVRAVILRGNDRFFSAGLDLAEMAQGGAEKMVNFGLDDGVFALWTLPKPTIAEISGHAVAGGSILALACDLRIAANGPYKIGLNETTLGLAFPAGAMEIARLSLPHHFLARLLLGGGVYMPDEALEVGYVHEVIERDLLRDRCLSVARELGQAPARAYAYNKASLQAEALGRLRKEPEEQRRKILLEWSSEETRKVFEKRLQSIKKD
jgi:enoyl-CoA hydratase